MLSVCSPCALSVLYSACALSVLALCSLHDLPVLLCASWRQWVLLGIDLDIDIDIDIDINIDIGIDIDIDRDRDSDRET